MTYAERIPEGTAVIGGGELLAPGEVIVQSGESYSTPWLYAAYSDHGIDGVSEAAMPPVRIHGLGTDRLYRVKSVTPAGSRRRETARRGCSAMTMWCSPAGSWRRLGFVRPHWRPSTQR